LKRNKEISDCWERGWKIGVKAQNGKKRYFVSLENLKNSLSAVTANIE